MKLGIIQPHYLPYSGYFSLIKNVDTFIFHDDIDYISNEWKNRNKIKICKEKTDTRWISVPVQFKNKNLKNENRFINKIKISNDHKWELYHLNCIRNAYRHCPYYFEIISILQDALEKKSTLLVDLNINLIKKILEYLQIKTDILIASDFKLSSFKKTEKIIKLCQLTNTSHYIANNKSSNYLDENMFKRNKIELQYQNYEHPIYEQDNHDFISHLSIIDMLMYHGKNSVKLL